MVLKKGIPELQSGKVSLFFHPMCRRDARSYIETKPTICSPYKSFLDQWVEHPGFDSLWADSDFSVYLRLVYISVAMIFEG